MKTMKVLLCAAFNPDNPARGLPSKITNVRKWQPVIGLEDAKAQCRAFIEKYDLGSGDWGGGDVKEDGVIFARVSYNGTTSNIGTCSECGNEFPLENLRPYKYEKTRKVCDDCEVELMEEN